MIRTLAFALGTAAAGVAASTATSFAADLCYDAEQQPPGAGTPPTNSHVFTCPTLGERTVPEIAEAGWLIVKLVQVSSSDGLRNQLLIRNGEAIFGNGFE